MAWDSEAVLLLRTAILDDVTPFEYSDARLTQILLAAAFNVTVRVPDRLRHAYRVDIENQTITPDPAGTGPGDDARDPGMLNLMILKAACSLQQGAVKTAAAQAIAIKDGASSIDTRGKLSGLLELMRAGKSFCSEYEDAVRVLQSGGVPGVGVLGVCRNPLTRRRV